MPKCPYCKRDFFSLGWDQDVITVGPMSNPKAKGYMISCRACKSILGILPEIQS